MYRKENDSIILEDLEKIEQSIITIRKRYEGDISDHLQEVLLEKSIKKIQTSRRIIEELSMPCRMLLEHFSYFTGDYNHSMGYKIGQFLDGRAVLLDFEVQEWGNIFLNLGSVTLKWRDEDYNYLFYPDKVMMKSKNRSNSDIFLSFSFSLKYTKVHQRYLDIRKDPQVEYWHEDLEL